MLVIRDGVSRLMLHFYIHPPTQHTHTYRHTRTHNSKPLSHINPQNERCLKRRIRITIGDHRMIFDFELRKGYG